MTNVYLYDRCAVEELYSNLKFDKVTAKYTTAEEKNETLLRKIRLWQMKQPLYMPGLPDSKTIIPMEDEDDENVMFSWEVILSLPSSVNQAHQKTICIPGLLDIELRLRETSAHQALQDIRDLICQERLHKLKKRIHVSSGPGQRLLTRANNAIQNIVRIRNQHVRRYRKNREVLSNINPNGRWVEELKELKDEDLTGPFIDNSGERVSEGRRTQSWIWGVKYDKVSNDKKSHGTSDAEEVSDGKN